MLLDLDIFADGASVSLVTAPVVSGVSLSDAKLQCKVDTSADDNWFATHIDAATQYCEASTRRKLTTQTWDYKRPAFPSGSEPIVLPFPPVASVTSVAYVDADGTTQTWTAGSTGYTTDLPAGPQADYARIYPSYNVSYPSTRVQRNAVTVRFVCGYGNSSDMPASITAAMLKLIEHWYMHRGVVTEAAYTQNFNIPAGVDALLEPFGA